MAEAKMHGKPFGILDKKADRRSLVKGAALTGAAAVGATSAVFHVPNIIRAQDRVKIQLWWPINSTNADWENAQELLAMFHEANPDIEVDAQTVSFEQLENRVVVASQGGELPDVAWALAEHVPGYYRLGVLADATDRWENWEGRSAINETLLGSLTYDGRIYSGVPHYLGVRNYQYHAEHFSEAGIEAPPATWDDLINVGLALKDTGRAGFGYCGTSVRLPQELIVYLWQNNLDIAVPVEGGLFRNTWADNPEELTRAAEVFQFYHDLMYAHGIVPQQAAAWTYQELDTNFAQGSISSVVNGPWMRAREDENPDTMADVAFAPIPYKLTPATFLEVNYLVTFANSPHPEEAWRLMQFFAGPDAQANPFYSNRTVRNDIPVEGKWAQPFLDLVPQGKTWPAIALGAITQHMIDAVQGVLLNQFSPEDAARTLSEQTNAALVEQGQG